MKATTTFEGTLSSWAMTSPNMMKLIPTAMSSSAGMSSCDSEAPRGNVHHIEQKTPPIPGTLAPCSDESLAIDRANAIVVGLRSAKWRFLENAAADRPEIWWLCSLRGTAPLRRSPGRGKMVCPSRISRAAVLGTNKQARHWLLCFTKGNQPLFISPSLYP